MGANLNLSTYNHPKGWLDLYTTVILRKRKKSSYVDIHFVVSVLVNFYISGFVSLWFAMILDCAGVGEILLEWELEDGQTYLENTLNC